VGILNIFKKKKDDSSKEITHIDLPSEPKVSDVNESDFTEPTGTLEPVPPEPTEIPELHPVPLDQAIPERESMPVAPEDNAHNAPNTAGETKKLAHELPQEEGAQKETKEGTKEDKPVKVEDDAASFEIPDFSDDDLDINIDVNEFKPEATDDEPSEEVEPELPKFEVSSSIDLDNADSWTTDTHSKDDEVKEEPVKVEEVKEDDFVKPFDISKIEKTVHEDKFIEQNEYIEVLVLEDEFKKEVKKIKTDISKIETHSAQEEKIYDSMTGIVTEIKDAILSMDAKLFTER